MRTDLGTTIKAFEAQHAAALAARQRLWFVRIRRTPRKRITLMDKVFSGVVFYELATDGKVSAIRSHGRASIYGYAIKEVILSGPET